MKDVSNTHSSYFTKENMFLSNKAGLRYSGAVIHVCDIFQNTYVRRQCRSGLGRSSTKSVIQVCCHALEAVSFALYPHTQHNAWSWPLYEDSGQGYGSGGFARHAHYFEVVLSAS